MRRCGWAMAALAGCPRGQPAIGEPAPPPSRVVVADAPVWPAPGALQILAPWVPPGWTTRRMMLDPGHAAPPDNLGNTGVRCQREADEMLRIATAIVPALQGPFDVRLTRPDAGLVAYPDRIAAANAWPADALVSLHSDARQGSGYGTHPDTGCPTSDGGRGFSVLWSDEGAVELIVARQRLARSIAARLRQAGFQAYTDGYADKYGADPDHPGVYVDRHVPDQRIAMLRRPTVPSVIVETHQALDLADADRWAEPGTWAAFGAALARGVTDALAAPVPAADGPIGDGPE